VAKLIAQWAGLCQPRSTFESLSYHARHRNWRRRPTD